MFKAYDVSNHAGLLRGMNRRVLGGPDSASGGLLASQQALQGYLAQPFKVPAKGSPEASLFAQAVLFAQKDATVKTYFAKLQTALKHKIASLKQQGYVDTDQAALDALPKRIAIAQDAVDKSKKELDKAFDAVDAAFATFLDWIQQSYRLAVQNHIYTDIGSTPQSGETGLIDLNQGIDKEVKISIPEQLYCALYNILVKGSSMLAPYFWGPHADKSFQNNTTYWGTGPVLTPLPEASELPAVVEDKKRIRSGLIRTNTGLAWSPKAYLWNFEPQSIPTRLRYTGASATRGGFNAAYSWNENFIPKLNGAIALYKQLLVNVKVLQDLQASQNVLTKSIVDEKAAAQAEQAAYAKGATDADAIKAKLSGFLRGYADTLGEQYTKAAELSGLTKAREEMQAQNAKWFAEYDAMTKQGVALVAQAEAETDAGRKAALRIEGARRLGRALEMNARGQSLRDGALKRYGERRSGAAKGLADAQAKTGLTLPPVEQAQVQQDTAKIAELNAAIAEIQKAADATKAQIKEGMDKLPPEFKPPNAPPPALEEKKGGAGWILALGAVGAAFIAYKRGH